MSLIERLYMFTVIFLKCLKKLFKIALKLPCSFRFERNCLRVTSLYLAENLLNAFRFPRQKSVHLNEMYFISTMEYFIFLTCYILLVSSFKVNDISVLIYRLNLESPISVSQFSVARLRVRFVFNLSAISACLWLQNRTKKNS